MENGLRIRSRKDFRSNVKFKAQFEQQEDFNRIKHRCLERQEVRKVFHEKHYIVTEKFVSCWLKMSLFSLKIRAVLR